MVNDYRSVHRNILIVDKDKRWHLKYKDILSAEKNFDFATNYKAAKLLLKNKKYSVIIQEIKIPTIQDGLLLLKENSSNSDCLNIIVTEDESLENAGYLFAQGCDYYYLKSMLKGNEIPDVIDQYLLRRQIAKSAESQIFSPDYPVEQEFLVGVNNKNEFDKRIDLLKDGAGHILITGETGTGKTLMAKYLHNNSRRKNNKFLHINCPSIPDNLLESELFGYTRGAFTGALDNKKGKFESAGTGTIFLDEIGEIPSHLQAKLLKVIDDRSFYPLGSLDEVKIKARLIAATNRDLDSTVAMGKFRQDLFYRLNTFRIHLPPLRERSDDIIYFFDYFVNFYCKKYAMDRPEIEKNVYLSILNYSWPGNIRELKNMVESILIFKPQVVKPNLLPIKTSKAVDSIKSGRCDDEVLPLKKYVALYVRECYKRFNGNKSLTANKLEINRKTLAKMLSGFNSIE